MFSSGFPATLALEEIRLHILQLGMPLMAMVELIPFSDLKPRTAVGGGDGGGAVGGVDVDVTAVAGGAGGGVAVPAVGETAGVCGDAGNVVADVTAVAGRAGGGGVDADVTAVAGRAGGGGVDVDVTTVAG